MLIIELNGVPGSGKSTLAIAVCSKLKDEGIAVGTRAEIHQQLKSNHPLLRALMLLPVLLRPKYFALGFRVLRFCLDYGIDAYRLYKVKNVIELDYLLDKTIAGSRFEVLLLDEGIIQHLHYIPNNKELNFNDNSRKVADFFAGKYRDNVVVNLNLDMEKTVGRLRDRGPITKHYIKMSAEERLNMLSVRESNIFTLRKIMKDNPSIDLDMENDVNDNADKVVSFIKALRGTDPV